MIFFLHAGGMSCNPRKWLGTAHVTVCILAMNMASAAVAAVPLQDFPLRTIRIMTGEPGTGNDFATRMIALELTAAPGQQVIVENHPSTQVVQFVARAQSDGYTLLLISDSMWIGPPIAALPYDPVKDFSPITLAISSPAVLIAHPAVPAKSVKELIELAKTRPGRLNCASSAVGGRCASRGGNVQVDGGRQYRARRLQRRHAGRKRSGCRRSITNAYHAGSHHAVYQSGASASTGGHQRRAIGVASRITHHRIHRTAGIRIDQHDRHLRTGKCFYCSNQSPEPGNPTRFDQVGRQGKTRQQWRGGYRQLGPSACYNQEKRHGHQGKADQ